MKVLTYATNRDDHTIHLWHHGPRTLCGLSLSPFTLDGETVSYNRTTCQECRDKAHTVPDRV